MITWRGACLGLVALVGLVLAVVTERRDVLLVSVSLALAVVLAVASLALVRRPVALQRQVPLVPVPAGTKLPIVLRGPEVEVGEPVVDLGPWGAAAALPTRPGVLVYWHRFARRGVCSVGPAVVQRTAPLGMARWSRAVAPPDEVLVAPNLIHLPIGPLRFDVAEHSAQTSATGPREVDPGAVRPYQSGDPRAKVHWRATARRGELMVRQDKPLATTDVWVVLDTVLASPPGKDSEATDYELAVSAAASLVMKLMAQNHRVHLLTTDGQVGGPFTQAGGKDPVLAAFARLANSERQTDNWLEALTGALPDRGGQVPIYLVLHQPVDPNAQPWMGQLKALAEPAGAVLVPAAATAAGQLRVAGWQVHQVLQRVTS